MPAPQGQITGNPASRRKPRAPSPPRRRKPRAEVAGPFRSQSSVPSVRSKATPHEHRTVRTVAPPAAPLAQTHPAFARALGLVPGYHGPSVPGTGPRLPNLVGMTARQREVLERQGREASGVKAGLKALHNEQGAVSNLEALSIAAALSPVGPEAFLAKVGSMGLERVAPAIARAIKASERIASESGAGSKLTQLAKNGVIRRAAAKAASKAEPAAVRATRLKALARAAKAAEKVPAPVRVGAKVGGRAVAFPVKHPFTSPLAAQAPAFALHGGDPKEFLKALEGHGTLAAITGALGSGAAAAIPGTAGQIANEAVNLPAVVTPSLYLTGKAGVEAAGGHPQNLDKLWSEYVKTGLLPALAQGNPKAALKALEDRPLYSALEASGAASAVGRGAGAIARAASNGRVGGLARPDLTVEGYPNVKVQRGYSRDLLRQLLQRAYDRKSGNVIRPGTGHRLTPTLERRGDYLFRKHVVRDAGDRFNANAQDAQRLGRQQAYKQAADLLPRKRVLGVFKKLDRASADVVVHAIERIVRHPETFHEDLSHYLDQLNAVANETVGGQPLLDKAELAANRSMAAQIKKARSLGPGRAQGTVDAANAFIEAQRPIVKELIDRGVLNPEQAAKAAAIPFARFHLRAGHGPPEGLIREAKANVEATRQTARETARGQVVGAVESRAVAARKLRAAEAGRTAAERTVATLRANLKADLAERKTPKGKKAAASRVERAQRTLEVARERVKAAKAERRATHAELHRRTRAAVRQHDATLAEAEKALSQARKMDNQLIDSEGFPLTAEQVRAKMEQQGIEPPGFISHRAGTRSDFWAPTNERGSIPKGRRTGRSALFGSHEAGFEAVLRQLGRSRGLLDRIKTWDDFVTRFGVVARGIKVDSMNVAKKVIRDPARYGLNPNIHWVALRRQPFTAMQSEIDAALKHQDPTLASEGILTDALAKARSGDGTDGPIVFAPADVIRNAEAQWQPLHPAMKGVQVSTTALKRAVLPFSPSYYFGNAIDNAIRTALAGVGPQHFVAGHQLGKAMSDEQKSHLLGAAYSSVEKLAAHRSHEDFAGSALQGVADASAAFRAAPGPKQLIDLVGKLSHAMLAINSKLTERLPQYGALGKIAMQDVRDVQGHWAALLRLQPEFVADIVKGLENPDTMIRYQKAIEDIYGNWSRMSPHARKYLTNFFPFWTWSRAALKLVYLTLPAHHPIQTALLTAAARMTQEEREKLGLDLLGSEPLPGYLQGGLPIRGSIAPWGKYTSFGYAGHPLESIASGVVPQIRETLAAGEGRDWKGSKLGGPELSHLGTAASGALGSFIPGYNTVEGLLRSGVGYLSPLHVTPPGPLPYLRSLSHSTQIEVPAKGSGSGSGIDYGNVFGGGDSNSEVDYGNVFGGGG